VITLQLIKGLKYPDEFVTKFFFKENLHNRKGRVLELGCAAGNNLMLFVQYGWDCVGIDFDPVAVADARYNLERVSQSGAKYTLIQHDLKSGLPPQLESCDVLLLPSVLYYLPRVRALICLEQASKLVRPGSLFFLRMRTPSDYRYRRGIEVEPNGFVLDIEETGEQGSLVVLYEEYELIEMLNKYFRIAPGSLRIIHVAHENFQNGLRISNNDIILRGQIEEPASGLAH
jgi:SAM-dependent methyltransferase